MEVRLEITRTNASSFFVVGAGHDTSRVSNLITPRLTYLNAAYLGQLLLDWPPFPETWNTQVGRRASPPPAGLQMLQTSEYQRQQISIAQSSNHPCILNPRQKQKILIIPITREMHPVIQQHKHPLRLNPSNRSSFPVPWDVARQATSTGGVQQRAGAP